jgi:hypothetical protein
MPIALIRADGAFHRIVDQAPAILSGYSVVEIEDGLSPEVGQIWNAETRQFDDPTPAASVPSDLTMQIVAERERRLALGFDYDFGDERGVHRIATTEQDMKGWDEVTQYANALVGTGDTTTVIGIVTETGPTAVTSTEWQQILVAAGQHRQPIWAASFALTAMVPQPEDFAADSYWPSIS